VSKDRNSRVVTKGTERAPHRSLLYAMGWDKTNLEKPLIGVANPFSELIPGHVHLRQVAEKVKEGVWSAGGVPAEFGTIGVCDGLAMGHPGMRFSLPSRESIAGMGLGLDLLLPEAELEKRKAAFSPVSKQSGSPFLDSYSQNVTSAAHGAIRKINNSRGNDEDKRS